MTNKINAMYIATNGTVTDSLGVSTGTASASGSVAYYYNGTAWDYWTNFYYPQVIHHSYPVYLQERAQDKGKQAFEIIKALQDKKLVRLEKVSEFIEAMDMLIKIL